MAKRKSKSKRPPKRAAKPKAQRATDPWIVPRLADVARFFARSHQTVRADWRGNGMPGTTGRWDLAEILRWRDERAAAGADPAIESRAEAARRREIAEADRAEVLAAREKAGIVDLDAVRRLICRNIFVAKAHLGGLADAVAAALPAETPATAINTARRRAEKAVDEALTTIAEILADPSLLPADASPEAIEAFHGALLDLVADYFAEANPKE